MSQHSAAIQWLRSPHPQDARTYSRRHVASLAGGQLVSMSAAVEYQGDALCAAPEQMLISAVASCHMLTFLATAERQQYRVESYQDNAGAYLEKVEGARMAVSRIEPSPKISFG